MNDYENSSHFHIGLNQAKVNAWLIGFVEGILVDDIVNDTEMKALAHEIRVCADHWDVPADMLDVAEDIEADCYDSTSDAKKSLNVSVQETLQLCNGTARYDEVRDLGRLAGIASDRTFTEGEQSLAEKICDVLDGGIDDKIEDRVARVRTHKTP